MKTWPIVLDTSKVDSGRFSYSMPSATYNATVDFYPKWKGNESLRDLPRLHAEKLIQLTGSGKTKESVIQKSERQKWVMKNVILKYPWDKKSLERRLGKSIKGKTRLQRNHHEAYYFPDTDVTMNVNTLLNEVTIWDIGNTITP